MEQPTQNIWARYGFNDNPYDSKGDYFMNIKDYGKAYESFMKAYEIDTLWSYKKAMKAKALYDSLQVE